MPVGVTNSMQKVGVASGQAMKKEPEGPLNVADGAAPDQTGQAAENFTALGRNCRTKPYSSGPRVFLVWVQP